jgi:hypothetical protein
MKKEACACLILELFRARGIPASGETIQSIGALNAAFLKSAFNANEAEFMTGLDFGFANEWWSQHGSVLKLLAAGHREISE